MKTITGAKWQPIGEQFAFACRVCFYRGSYCEECNNCKCEKKPGFVFDPDKFIELCREMNKERYLYNGKSIELIRPDKKELDGIMKDELLTARPNYEAMYEKLQEEHKKLCTEYAAVKTEYKSLESEFERMRAQLDIVYLIFGNR